jgi:GcrA cell cycle regulator
MILTDDQRAEFTAQWLAGTSLVNMSADFDCSLTTISRTAAELGLERRGPGPRLLGSEIGSRIAELWNTGVPASGIALALNMTKNAVIGKARRMHLCNRPSPIIRYGVPSAPRGPRVPKPLPELAAIPRVPVVREPIRAPVPLPLAPIVAQPMRGTCQWVLTLRPALFCDQPAVAFRRDGSVCPEGAVWCRIHRHQVYSGAAA